MREATLTAVEELCSQQLSLFDFPTCFHRGILNSPQDYLGIYPFTCQLTIHRVPRVPIELHQINRLNVSNKFLDFFKISLDL